MKSLAAATTFVALASCMGMTSFAQQTGKAVTVSGLVVAADSKGIQLRNRDGQFTIQWNKKTRVALQVNTRLLSGFRKDVFRYKVHSSNQVINFAIPSGPITGVVRLRNSGRVASALKMANDEHWIPERGLEVEFGRKLEQQLPTAARPRFVGLWDPSVKPRTLTINDRKYELSLKKGGQANALLFGFIDVADCKPFVNRARIIGRSRANLLIAEEIQVLPVGDQTAGDKPLLPRYLFIGDSISGNYSKGLRKTLDGQFNIHHPPTNCGPSAKGKNNIVEWLGGYRQKGRHWDVISFNFGHWDAGNDKAAYQSNLEAVVRELKKTGAKLIWVTTCPVPKGYAPAGELSATGKAPRRTSGVMAKYLNPWSAQVISRHPDISICDQWQFVKEHENDIYREWWSGKNVHFRGRAAESLGNLLAQHVRQVTRKK